MLRDIARHHRRAHAGGLERRDLLVHRADDHPLFVAQHRRVDRSWNVVFSEFERRAHIHDFIESCQLIKRHKQVFQLDNTSGRPDFE